MQALQQRSTGARGHYAAPRARVPARVPRLQVFSQLNGVPTTTASLEQEVQRLRAENEHLRRELEQWRGSSAQASGSVQVEMAPAHTPGAFTVVRSADSVTTMPASELRDMLTHGINWPTPGERFWERSPRNTPFPLQLEDSVRIPKERDAQALHIVHISAELAPIGKVGGLGDVVSGLSKACLERGHNVAVIMPFYESLDQKQIEGLKHEMDIDVPKGYVWDGEMRVGSLRTSVFWGRVGGVPVYLLRPTDWGSCNIFKGGRIYGGSYDEREAYLYMCRAALEFLKVSGQQPHIIQVHDWHAAAVPLLYWDYYHAEGLHRPRVVLTIHNMDNTGEVRQDEFAYTGVHGEVFAQLDKALDERTIGHNPERLNLMKGGVIYSNAVTTVSPTYASDIVNAGAGGFLRPVFNQDFVKDKFRGILNGVDAVDWDPSKDPLLPANYNADLRAGKAACKEFLQRGLGMAVDPAKPLVAVVSRLVNQKNPGLMEAAAFRCRDMGAQFVLLGSGGQDGGLKRAAAGELKDHPDVRIMIMYSERLSHMIYAAADVVLVPSNFEPCGLTQMIAMRYGALPVVRRTGGLADTVRDMDNWSGPEEERNGWTFDGADAGSMNGALDRAIRLFKEQPQRWAELSERVMRADVSWALPAKEYVALYRSIAQL
mmetsp:Transcript_9372/g.23219  ORF Transcript_9372/g.23219 Transcript_9372/m.23219 type:complete len:657 (-) Transcript_9372:563-2533(-)|eukprot:CAMPEP_0202865732 /NCGR_PEP_ID=MMETSP1391-20130828/6321_1 /ASSEMBLY_ACC=CAM_ASM_000867 /TAXON_ID=1034604 /ORGANISM="Chlamydomonas leiostraca, Strain SAG 11-49" /LENGTH=656 /DNA_ID=CAMNT_0049545607 /DNA_START=72 /DNA_END=2042 /DNA_ORIENTATION=+